MNQTLLPKNFQMLEPLVSRWALTTQNTRQALRISSTKGELQYFYDNMLPRLPAIMEHVDQFPLGQLPPESERLFALALTLAEIAPHIELYNGDPNVPHSFAEMRMIAEHGDYRL